MKLRLIAPLAAIAVLAVPAYATTANKPAHAKTVKHAKKTAKKGDAAPASAPAPTN
jgi:hypothetical protein